MLHERQNLFVGVVDVLPVGRQLRLLGDLFEQAEFLLTFLRIERALARCTDRLVVLSERQEREILGFGVGRPEQMVRIPLGLELEPFLSAERRRGELRSELGLPDETPLVGIVARLVPIKAHGLFLEAARRVAHCRPDTRFLIVGDGELRDTLEQQARALGFEVRRSGVRRSGVRDGSS